MADISYRCHHCGSVHEVEAIRENLYIDQRSIASYGVSRRLRTYCKMRWLARQLAAALWPRYPRRARHLWARQPATYVRAAGRRAGGR